jgi:bifunctional non-homologous end joining protein LigD
VGTGFSAATLRMLGERLEALRRDTPPLPDVPREHARSAVWVEPVLVCDVDFTEWTREGRLRHPSYKGLRDDVDPRSVRRT